MNTGQICKSKSTSRYTTIPNELIQNKNLSAKAKGIIVYLLSLPDNWVVYKTELHNNFTDGKDSIRSGFDELVEAGYIVTVDVRDENGRFKGSNHIVYDLPISENPISVNPTSVNPPLQKKHNTKETKEKEYNADFLKFYSAYPRKAGKQAASIRWQKLSNEQKEKALKAVERYADAEKETELRYIPYPATWLNDGRYDNYLSKAQKRKFVM